MPEGGVWVRVATTESSCGSFKVNAAAQWTGLRAPGGRVSVERAVASAAELLDHGDVLTARAFLSGILAVHPDSSSALACLQEVEKRIAVGVGRLNKHEAYLESTSRMPSPNVGFTGTPGARYDGVLPYDNWGFLNATLPEMPKPADERRIFVVGDSTMCGGSSLDQTVPGLVGRLLPDVGEKETKVYNFSVASSRATQMLALVLHRLVDLAPDVLLVCVGAAEVYVPLTYDPRPDAPYNFYVVEELYERYFDPSRRGSRAATDRAALMEGVAARQAKLRAEIGAGTPAWASDHLSAFASFVEKLDRISAAWGIDTRLVLQPLVTTKQTVTDHERGTCGAEARRFFDQQYSGFRGVLGPGAGGDVLSWGRNLLVHDASDVFDTLPGDVYEDFVHYNDSGRRAMAVRLAAVLSAGRRSASAVVTAVDMPPQASRLAEGAWEDLARSSVSG